LGIGSFSEAAFGRLLFACLQRVEESLLAARIVAAAPEDWRAEPLEARRVEWRQVSTEQAMKFTRITVNPKQMGGLPCIRGLRIPVATVVGMVADGMKQAEIPKAYPDLVEADITEALQYAAEAVRERELPLAAP